MDPLRSTSYLLSLQRFTDCLELHSFPTRRSSDLVLTSPGHTRPAPSPPWCSTGNRGASGGKYSAACASVRIDRKSTRLNSSHVASSYAVYCLKKKNRKSRN